MINADAEMRARETEMLRVQDTLLAKVAEAVSAMGPMQDVTSYEAAKVSFYLLKESHVCHCSLN